MSTTMLLFNKCSVVVTTLLLFSTNHGVCSLPNIIVMQPDDMEFYDDWSPPPNNPKVPNKKNNFPAGWQLPNIDKLRTNGLWMKQAYAASPMCGTSRYSTLTGRYPARSASSRNINTIKGEDVAYVTIPTTKLTDDDGLNDCSEDNLAAVLQASGLYRTGMFGKWHLSKFNEGQFTYAGAQTTVEGCGFDKVDGLYVNNLEVNSAEYNNIHDGSFSHNMEWVTETAIEFINDDTTWGDKPFFMYFNPTAPHTPSIEEALSISCRNTANIDINPIDEPVVKGMTLEKGGCENYRDYVKSRGTSNGEYGAIWVDDAVGAIYQALEDKGVLDNTIILFQLDHGKKLKFALYENGVRIPQFVHYPDGISPGSEFDAPVSTIDVAPTMLEFAGVTVTYEMDGTSWKDAILNSTTEEEWKAKRCLFFEADKDKVVRCGCYKYLDFYKYRTTSRTHRYGVAEGYSTNASNLFDLCDEGTSYVTDNTNNMERDGANVAALNSCTATDMETLLQCYADRVDYREVPDYTPCPYVNSCSTSSFPSNAPTTTSMDVPTDAPTASSVGDSTSSFPSNAPTTTSMDVPTDAPTASSVGEEDEEDLSQEALNTALELLLAIMNFLLSLFSLGES